MELRHLRYFAVLARRKHFTQAAEELFIAQPALSQQIQALELELGVKLLERTSRQVRLTPAGEAFLQRAWHILAEAEQLEADMQAFAGLTRGRITLGLLQSLGAFRLPALLARFHAQYPGIEIALQEGVTKHLLEQVKAGQMDMAFIHSVGDIFPVNIHDPQLIAEAIVSEEIVLVVGAHHRLAGSPMVEPGELVDEAFILFKPGSGLRQAALHLGVLGAFTPRILCESGDIGTIRALVAEGLGISVLPQSVAEMPGSPIAVVQIKPPLPARTVMLARHKRAQYSPATSTFLSFVHADLQLHPWSPLP